jgi:hypothetical protein
MIHLLPAKMKRDGVNIPMIRFIQIMFLLSTLALPGLGLYARRNQDTAPPPLKIIPRLERTQMNESKDAKARVKITLEFAEQHLANSESATARGDFDAAALAAGKYWALVEDVFGFMKTLKTDSNKTRDLYKRVELTLRAQGPRIVAIRRTTPLEYAVWIKEIEDFARRGRTEALNSFYGHTVISDRQQKPSGRKPEEKPNP